MDLYYQRLEIKWGDWRRQDGTNTTWQEVLENEELTKAWAKKMKEDHTRLARENLAVDILDSTLPSHVFRTLETANGFQEKLKRSADSLARYRNWNIAHADSEAGSSTRSSRSRESVPPQSTSAKRPAPPPSGERQSKKTKTVVPSARQALLQRWSRACKAAGAPPVRIRNDVDDQEIPPLDPRFIYIENDFYLGILADEFEEDEAYLAGCECVGPCEGDCNCLELISDEDGPTPAYDAEGLFRLDRSVVVECNKLCACGDECSNRVAQKGRDVEIEIFRTEDRGWGARSLQDLPKGKFLGLYTGRLIRREDAANLSDSHRSYTFDIDSLDNGPGVPDDRRYSVDAHSFGNWTRFVNHSCSPNVQVYSVMWDSTPQMNRPYLAFVTNQVIPAETELTIDYDPKAAYDRGKRRRPPGSKECRCGSACCRGWVAV
ncbi:hypothetical protein NM688_g4793 [Phlebia brevispora]|uniref:Uncharacterized protein n=1 Tax=Phlebia brevispora TaxID=194682 RepID=A0ACC1T1Y5_9APHY|nr:hypothetical protein NM688_g4793 [Phlebia brevispora]